MEEKLDEVISILIGFVILFVVSLCYVQNVEQIYYIYSTLICIAIILIFGLLMLFSWRKHINSIYIEKVNKRNIDILELSLSEQKSLNEKLQAENDNLSKIIHRDNKIIPAMELAVEEILNCKSPEEQKEKSQMLLGQLKDMTAERKGIVREYENSGKKLPKTGIESLDASINYLFYKATGNNISMDLSILSDISGIIDNVVSGTDLNTLILDLGENAVIAVSSSDIRNILIVLGMENDCFCMSIFDSGNKFDKKVLENLGTKRITTHKSTGGTGIGIMTTFELLKKYNASFILDENIQSSSYVKKVSVCFDNLNRRDINI